MGGEKTSYLEGERKTERLIGSTLGEAQSFRRSPTSRVLGWVGGGGRHPKPPQYATLVARRLGSCYYCSNQNLWDWQPHCKSGHSTLVVLCAGSTLLLTPVVPATSQLATPSEVTPLSYWSIKHWFLTEGNLLPCSSYLTLGVPQQCEVSVTISTIRVSSGPIMYPSLCLILLSVDCNSRASCSRFRL
jgi:hypothetical protein